MITDELSEAGSTGACRHRVVAGVRAVASGQLLDRSPEPTAVPRATCDGWGVSVLGILLAWWAVTALGLVPDVLLPGPAEVLATFVDLLRNGYRDTTLLGNALSTLWRCGAGYLLACLTGIPLGLAMGSWPPARAACGWIVEFMRPLPPLPTWCC